jgi:hypothetical protein
MYMLSDDSVTDAAQSGSGGAFGFLADGFEAFLKVSPAAQIAHASTSHMSVLLFNVVLVTKDNRAWGFLHDTLLASADGLACGMLWWRRQLLVGLHVKRRVASAVNESMLASLAARLRCWRVQLVCHTAVALLADLAAC